MQEIIIATLTVGVIGLLIGTALVAASEKFYVKVDAREAAVRKHLPGNNCGACGYAGCDAVAGAIVRQEVPVGICPVADAQAIAAMSEIMGVEAQQRSKKAGFIRCAGDCQHTNKKGNYVGIRDCRAAFLTGLSLWDCDYGCLGLGSCADACPQDAIHIEEGVARIDRDRCAGCGICISACPKNLIELVPVEQKIAVRCSSQWRGRTVRNVCSIGCIGCKLCEKECEHGAVKVENNIAHIDYEKCTGCGKCAEKCPSQIIIEL